MKLFVLLLLVLAGPARAGAARLLRQDVHTISGLGKNPIRPGRTQIFAQAHEAEARSNPTSSGLFHNEATMMIEGDLFPGPRGTAGTLNAQQLNGRARAAGGVPGLALDVFGPYVNVQTDTERARAVSAPEGLPLHPSGLRGAYYAKGRTTALWDSQQLQRGTGKQKQVLTESIGANSLAPLSSAISNVGGGPIAVAAAGQAVAVANADTPMNGDMA
ncbi:MAG: hypothetical protein J3K34DRAFT_525812 [Monoraphidium minutum]|nr:MAG: hypothetical protein J3K34DRAFT_525812 [Monoraphidium minutum]